MRAPLMWAEVGWSAVKGIRERHRPPSGIAVEQPYSMCIVLRGRCWLDMKYRSMDLSVAARGGFGRWLNVRPISIRGLEKVRGY
jgi:hypothetical protein